MRWVCLLIMFGCAIGIILEASVHDFTAMIWAIISFILATSCFISEINKD